MTPLILVLAAASLLPELPSDPFQRTATRAIRGDFGTLKPWQSEGYKMGLARGVKADTFVWVTCYSTDLGRDGRRDSKGNPCTLKTAAANEIPRTSYVWIEPAGELRQILDCGAKRNDRIGRHKGKRAGRSIATPGWVDVWYKRSRDNPFGGSCIGRIAVIGTP